MERDKEVSKHYKKRGWGIIRIWEHKINSNLAEQAQRITKIVYAKK